MDEEDVEEEDEEVVLLLLLAVAVPLLAVLELDGFGGGAPCGAANTTGFMCPDSSAGSDRGATWDTGDDSVPWVSPTPSGLLHATIAIIARHQNFDYPTL